MNTPEMQLTDNTMRQEQHGTPSRQLGGHTGQAGTSDFIPEPMPSPLVIPRPRPRLRPRPVPATTEPNESIMFSVAGQNGVAINITPQTSEEKAKEYIDNSLICINFNVRSQAQQKLEDKYKESAIPALAARLAAYESGMYVTGESIGTSLSKASLPILMSGTQGFISSALRTPVGNTVSLALDPTKAEFITNCARIGTAGVVSGLSAYLTSEVFISAIDRCAKAGNVPKIEAVNVAHLLPEPGRIVLSVVDGKKSYTYVDEIRYAEMKDTHAIAMKKALGLQNMLSGKGYFPSFLQPILTAGANAMRRAYGTPASLLISSELYFSSALASGLAGGITKAGLSLAQVTPWLSQIEVDNFTGGKEKINLFEVRNPDPDVTRSPAQLCDLGTGLCQTGAEIIALGSHTLNLKRPLSELLHQAQDVARYVTSNVLSNGAAAGLGILISSDYRGDGLVSSSSEAYNSSAKLLRQGVQSGTNELAWKAFQEITKADSYSLGDSMDIKRRRQR